MGPAIRVPLDGTEYDLTTGAVITWCPGGGNPVKAVLGALKKAAAVSYTHLTLPTIRMV